MSNLLVVSSLTEVEDGYCLHPSGLLVPFRKRLTAIDLFSGCGGMSLGIIQAGFEVVAAVDWDVAVSYTHLINLVFRKNYSPQVLKANMRIVGNCEYGLVLYRDKLPKFNNGGKMVFNCIDYPRDNKTQMCIRDRCRRAGRGGAGCDG